MDPTQTVRMQSKSALLQLEEGVSTCLQFRMADGVHQVLQQKRHLTNMAKATIARRMVKEAAGQTMFMSFKVCRSADKCCRKEKCERGKAACNAHSACNVMHVMHVGYIFYTGKAPES